MGCLLLEIAVSPLRITFLQCNTSWLGHAVFALSPTVISEYICSKVISDLDDKNKFSELFQPGKVNIEILIRVLVEGIDFQCIFLVW